MADPTCTAQAIGQWFGIPALILALGIAFAAIAWAEGRAGTDDEDDDHG